MTPVETVLAKLPDAKKSGKGWSARCPAHEDRRASLSVSAGDDDRALVKCHAGCETEAILRAIGLKLSDLFSSRSSQSANGNGKSKSDTITFPTWQAAVQSLEITLGPRAAIWIYHDAEGEPIGLTLRWDKPGGKEIRPVSRHENGWRIGAMLDPRPLYGLPALAAAQRVVVCEGEKAADMARALGFVATTSSGGSQAGGKTDWRPLAGKEVWILADNDNPGRKYADTVTSILADLRPAPVVKLIDLPDLPEGGDIVDWADAQGDAVEPSSLRAEIEAMAEATPPHVDDGDLTFKPFPVDALPGFIRQFVADGAKAIGCDPSYIALPLLTAIAAAIGNTRRLLLKQGWSAPPILWSAIIGESGTAKSPAFKLVMRPVRERQRKALASFKKDIEKYQAEYARWEKEMTAWKRNKNSGDEPPKKPEPPACERFIVSDTTVEALAPILLANPRGLLMSRDELRGWFGSFDRYSGKVGADAANWLSMFNGEAIVNDRRTGIPPTIYVPNAAVCVTGGIQPGILHRALSDEHRESGLAARLLLTWPPRKAKQWTEAEIDPAVENALAILMDRLFDLQPTTSEDGDVRPVLLRLTPEAKEIYIAYYNAHGHEQVDLNGDMAAAWSKLEEYAARLALVIHLIRWAESDETLENADKVDVVSMRAAIRLTAWFKHEARRVYAMLDESDEKRDRRQLVEWIERRGGSVTIRQVQQGYRRLKSPGAAEQALIELVKAGLGSWQDFQTSAKGGHPSRRFVLSTPSTSTVPRETQK
jgi:hypothetical protein